MVSAADALRLVITGNENYARTHEDRMIIGWYSYRWYRCEWLLGKWIASCRQLYRDMGKDRKRFANYMNETVEDAALRRISFYAIGSDKYTAYVAMRDMPQKHLLRWLGRCPDV